jgi:putative signal transducing protein
LQMFCPECKSEFIEGITKCPVCDIKLIDELPPELEFVDYKEILATYNQADIAFLKSLLDSEDISYFFKGKHFMSVRPLVDPVRLMVRTDHVV